MNDESHAPGVTGAAPAASTSGQVQGVTRAEHSDRGPKPKLSKAERRELQEKQRAAKLAKSSPDGRGAGYSGASGTKIAPVASSSSTGQGKPPAQKVSELHATEKRVHMFSHLDDHKRGALPPVVKGDVHPAIIGLGRKYARGEVTGATARAVAMLVAFKHVIADYSTPPDKMLSWDLDKKLRPMMQYLIDCRPHSVSMGNAYKALRNVIAKSPPSSPEAEAKASIIEKINEFINTRITLAGAEIGKNAIAKIRDGDVILTFGRSSVVESMLKAAQRVTRRAFRVIVVDSRPGVEGRQLADTLALEGISCTYVLLTAISYIMTEVTKVFLGASAMMSNGTVLSRVGTAVVAMMARSHNLPVMFCCETYKFCERVQLDSIVYNELGNPDDLLCSGDVSTDDSEQLARVKLLNLRYDLTPIKYVTLVITEFGFLPPTSVPVLIRELTRREDKDDKY